MHLLLNSTPYLYTDVMVSPYKDCFCFSSEASRSFSSKASSSVSTVHVAMAPRSLIALLLKFTLGRVRRKFSRTKYDCLFEISGAKTRKHGFAVLNTSQHERFLLFAQDLVNERVDEDVLRIKFRLRLSHLIDWKTLAQPALDPRALGFRLGQLDFGPVLVRAVL